MFHQNCLKRLNVESPRRKSAGLFLESHGARIQGHSNEPKTFGFTRSSGQKRARSSPQTGGLLRILLQLAVPSGKLI